VSLVPVLSPDSEAELASVVAMLEARGVPCFVRGGGIGSLLPGVQVESFNTRAIMVPEDRAAEALALIADLHSSSDNLDNQPPPASFEQATYDSGMATLWVVCAGAP